MLRSIKNQIGQVAKRSNRKFTNPRSKLNMEQLEARELMIVGAFGLPAIASQGSGYDGVVEIRGPGGTGCTGTLLDSGRHVLTAAHCVDGVLDANRDGKLDNGDGRVDPGTYTVRFDMSWGSETYNVPASNISVPTGNFNGLGNWNGSAKKGRDIAVLKLDQIAPHGAERYHPYSGTDEEDRWAFIVGYGRFGRGDQKVGIDTDGDGDIDDRRCDGSAGDGQKRIGTNYFDDTDGPRDSELELDFDSDPNNWVPGSDRNNSANGLNEVGIAGGDSGGPSFLWGPTGLEVAAVTSRGTSDRCTDAWYDPGMTFTRVSSWAGWIDQQMASRDDIVLDMTQQPGVLDGTTDYIHVNDSNGTLTISFDGQTVHNETLANVTSFRILGSSWDESFTFYVNGTRLQYTLDGGGGTDAMTVTTGSGNDSLYVYNQRVDAVGSRINYSNVESLSAFTGSGNDYISVVSTNSGTPVTVNGSFGDDRINIGNLNSIASNLTIYGGSQNDQLIIRDNQSTGQSYTLSSNALNVQRKAGWQTGFSGIENLMLQTGSGNDTVNSSANLNSMTTTVRSGAGNDTLNGGAGREIFIGDDGDDTIHGGGGRDILVGGQGADTLNGGSGDDILVDGYTSYDYNDLALSSLMKEWSRTDRSYTQRVANLENGGGYNGNYRLNSNSIASDYYVDTLTGGTERDWFWAQNVQIFTFPGQPPAKPRDSLTDVVWVRIIGQPDNTENVN